MRNSDLLISTELFGSGLNPTEVLVGESTLSFSSDGGQPEVYLYWRNRYLGV